MPTHISVESPDKEVVVDFLDCNALVTIKHVDGKLEITVRAAEEENSSSWDLHEFEVTLPC